MHEDNKYCKQHIESISSNEFIVCEDDGFFKYNIKSNSFSKLGINNKNWHCANIVFNEDEKKLYIHNGIDIKCINIITNVSKTFENVQDGIHFLYINNCFHVIRD